jgi:Zn-dependent peptidase ImmA (M78 family)/transcriptional regulator with XRE-family HTH domain
VEFAEVDKYIIFIYIVNYKLEGVFMIGDRIKQARTAAGLSLRGLASKIDNYVSAQAINKYEHGKSVPGSDVLVKIAKALDINVEYFFRPSRVDVNLGEPVYRKRSSVGKKQQHSIRFRVKEKVEKYLEVEDLFPPARFEKFHPTGLHDMIVKKPDDIEIIARNLRKAWKLGIDPIANLTEVLEERGIKVVAVEGYEKIDGLSCLANDSVPVIVVNGDVPSDRLRFNIAHELGHLLLKLPKSIDPEKAAHRFAGAFLVPQEAVELELGKNRTLLNMNELLILREKYGMSIQAWIMRAGELGIISGSYKKLLIRYLKKQGLFQKPIGKPLPPEIPKRFERLVIQAIVEDLISPVRGAELLDISLNEIREKLSGGRIGEQMYS